MSGDVLVDFLFGLGPIEAVQGFFGLGWPLPFRILSLLGDTWGVVLAAGVAFWLFGRGSMYGVVVIAAFAAGSWRIVNGLFSVSRPAGPGITVYEHLEVGAFPSGHVTQAVAVWGLLFALGRVRFRVPATVAVLTGLGRLYLGAHFLGDVIGGILYGSALVALFAPLWSKARPWLAELDVRLYMGLAMVTLAGGILWLFQLGGRPGGRRGEVVGLILAAALVLPSEWLWLRYRPGSDGARLRATKVTVGLVGLGVVVLLDRTALSTLPLFSPAAAAVAVAWVVLGAPAVFQALHGSRPPHNGP